MSEFLPVETLEDLERLDQDDVLAGYRFGLDCEIEPGSDRSRGFWHGWRNAQTDRGRAKMDEHQSKLARAYLGSKVRAH